jgi:hypothetical protein
MNNNFTLPEFTFNLHPSRTSHKRPWLIPFLNHFNTGAQRFEPQMQNLFTALHEEEDRAIIVRLKTSCSFTLGITYTREAFLKIPTRS